MKVRINAGLAWHVAEIKKGVRGQLAPRKAGESITVRGRASPSGRSLNRC